MYAFKRKALVLSKVIIVTTRNSMNDRLNHLPGTCQRTIKTLECAKCFCTFYPSDTCEDGGGGAFLVIPILNLKNVSKGKLNHLPETDDKAGKWEKGITRISVRRKSES